jgi:hypothetical protein
MASYITKPAKASVKVEAEVIANRVGLAVHVTAKETKAVGRGFWNGLLGHVAVPDAVPADAAVPSIDDIATMVAAKVLDAQAAKAKR